METTQATAVLYSGGLDSAILVAELAQAGSAVQPIYVRGGLAWESVELRHAIRFLETLAAGTVSPLKVLDVPLHDVLGEQHWSLSGRDVPNSKSPDEAVFLPGRNVLLLAKTLVWCHLAGIDALSLATLRGNPFPDATAAFFDAFAGAVNRALGGRLHVLRPYGHLDKRDVMHRGAGLALALEHTFSCLAPVGSRHCGQCNKCAERRRAFAEAGIPDATDYAAAPRA